MATPVKGKHSGPKEAVLAFAKSSKRYDEVVKFVNQLYSQNIFDAFLICAQSANETSNWTDENWTERLNPGGIGVTRGKDFRYTFSNGADAAKAMLIHHCAYTGTDIPDEWKDWIELDPRFEAVFKAGYNGKITNWEDYGNGYWAEDPHYFEAVTSRAKAMLQGGKMPNIIDKWLHVAQDGYGAVERRYRGRFGMAPKAIFVHIQEGYNRGSWEHFHVATASATVLIGRNGDIWRLVPEEDSPWTNGDVQSPTQKGRDLINTYGPDPNVYSLTIETEGFTGEWPKNKAQLDSVVWQIKTWMKKYNIPLSRVYRHADVNQVTRPNCPGNTYFNYLVNRIQAEGLDDTNAEPAYVKVDPILVGDKKWDGSKDFTRSDGTIFHAEKRVVTAEKEGAVHVWATKDSPTTRGPLKIGEEIKVLGWVEGEDVGGESRWWISSYHSRIWAGNTKEKPKEEGDDDNADRGDFVIHNGRVYYPTREKDDSRKLVITKDADLYKSVTTRSDKVGSVKKGDEVVAAYYVFGEKVDDEALWWVLTRGESNPITQGPRLHASATGKERPD